MSTQPVRIDWEGKHGTIHVDGHDISGLVHAASIDLEAREIPTVKLELLAASLSLDLDTASVEIDPETRERLISLGWQPPDSP